MDGKDWRERQTDQNYSFSQDSTCGNLKLCTWYRGKKPVLGEGVCVSKRTFISLPGPAQPLSLMMPAAEEDSVAMRRKLNFIIALPYLMSVSQAAGDVLMNLELYSL